MHALNIHQSNINIKKYPQIKAFLQIYASRQRITEAYYLLFQLGEGGGGQPKKLVPKLITLSQYLCCKKYSNDE